MANRLLVACGKFNLHDTDFASSSIKFTFASNCASPGPWAKLSFSIDFNRKKINCISRISLTLSLALIVCLCQVFDGHFACCESFKASLPESVCLKAVTNKKQC